MAQKFIQLWERKIVCRIYFLIFIAWWACLQCRILLLFMCLYNMEQKHIQLQEEKKWLVEFTLLLTEDNAGCVDIFFSVRPNPAWPYILAGC